MSHPESPSFGNAWTSTESATTSDHISTPVPGESAWNPAHRPDSNQRHARTISSADDANFFEDLSESTPERSNHSLGNVEEALESPPVEENSSVVTTLVPVTEVAPLSQHSSVTADAQTLPGEQLGAENGIAEGDGSDSAPATAIEKILNTDEEEAILKLDEPVQQQERRLDQEMPAPAGEDGFISSQGAHSLVQHDAGFENELGQYEQHGEAYEHQGDVTDMEKAIDEAPNAPLLDDPEAPPLIDEVVLQPAPVAPIVQDDLISDTIDAAGANSQLCSQSKPMLDKIDRSFTTNFTEVPTLEEGERKGVQEQESLESSGWPAAGDDKTFGELLDDTEAAPPQPVSDPWDSVEDDDTFGQLLGDAPSTTEDGSFAQQTQDEPFLHGPADAPTEKTEDELAAMFAAALGDDDFLEDPSDLDPSAFFGDDDPGFLEDEFLTDAAPEANLVPILPSVDQASSRTTSYIPAAQRSPVPTNRYAAPGLGVINQSHGRSAGTPSTGLYDVYNHGGTMQQPQAPQHSAAQSGQSFADRAKGGYESPFDLPVDVVKQPRRRPQQPSPNMQAMPTPPPRTSSMSSQQGQPPLARQPTSTAANMTPLPSAGSVPPPRPNTSQGPVAVKPSPSASSGFFEDLPVAPRSKARPSAAYAPPNQIAPTLPPMQSRPPTAPPQSQPQQRLHMPSQPTQQFPYGGLTQPEMLPLLPEQPSAPTAAQVVENQGYAPSSLPTSSQVQNRFSPAPAASVAANSRYSPAPTAQQSASKKYGPAPAATPGHSSIQNARPFAPRTSSPLASFDRPNAAQFRPQMPSSPPKTNGRSSPSVMSPDRSMSLNYSPSEQRAPSLATIASPPQRLDNYSPPFATRTTKYAAQTQSEQPSLPAAAASAPEKAFLHHRRQFWRELTFAAPNDERVQDPLERWKGHPIFKWGESGTVMHSFPKQTPFYATGQSMPSIKCTPGSITIQPATLFEPMEEVNTKFPGPLPSKSKKKKDVLTWMTSKIGALDNHAQAIRADFNVELALKQRADEKLVLWKIVKIFVEHDGKLEGDKKLEEEIRAVLLPNLSQMSQVTELQSPINTPGAGIVPDPVDNTVVVQLRQALLEGQRERAVWLAEEKKLWGHAMLIASTMGADTWRQIVQSFVRSQVKTVGSDARSLAALYQVFAGNAEECVDELVPPSARAGFQMVSKTAGAISGNPLEGLDQWQETLGLIAGNRTPTDGRSLLSLGKLLSGYGRAEAAHTCFLFARMLSKHTGADDPDATFVLLGANHQKQDELFGNDLDTIILTEIYEWSSSFSMQKAEYTPHLQPFKLMHAQQLAAYGLQSKAQAYCDHITTAYQSTTRPSPYYHPAFTQSVSDFSAFLSQAPQSGSQGLLSKGAMNNVKSKTSSWFTKFVSGDDDQASNASAAAGSDASGPFGRVNGDSPDISRVGSSTDLYGPMIGGGLPTTYGAHPVATPQQQFQPLSGSSKYAPSASGGSRYAPASSASFAAAEQRPGTSSSRSYAPSRPGSALGVPRPEASRAASDYSVPYNSDSRRVSVQLSSGSHEPRPMLTDQSGPQSSSPMMPQQHTEQVQAQPAYQALNGSESQNYDAPNVEAVREFQPSTSSYGYEPPSTTYEPPSYQPYQPDPEPEEAEPQSTTKKKGIMDDDDDDDLMARAAAVKGSSTASASAGKSEADRIAEDNFRKAAEADAARDQTKGGDGKKGWFGGWFGGSKKDEGMPQQQQSGPIKAKLGEQNSFYFDKELGKWVNKKDPKSSESASGATPPPPPRGPPSWNVISPMGPPSGPPSRVASGVGLAGSSAPPGASSSAFSAIPGSGPPSRMGTPAGGADAPPLMNPVVAALNGSGPPVQPPSRPSTSLSNASSIDDLLGGPPGPGQRKAGTVKGKKKGGRYVDVMAK